LAGELRGGDFVTLLISLDYKGPIIYTEGSRIPEDKEHLFTEHMQKKLRTAAGLIGNFEEVVKAHLKKNT